MSYKNAKQVLPDELIREVQQYVQGELIYIPQCPQTKRKWGEKSGIRKELEQRNGEIIKKFRRGSRIAELADEYYLSEDSIRKIVC